MHSKYQPSCLDKVTSQFQLKVLPLTLKAVPSCLMLLTYELTCNTNFWKTNLLPQKNPSASLTLKFPLALLGFFPAGTRFSHDAASLAFAALIREAFLHYPHPKQNPTRSISLRRVATVLTVYIYPVINKSFEGYGSNVGKWVKPRMPTWLAGRKFFPAV